MSKKLYISLIFSNLMVSKTLSSNHRMYNLYTKFVKILEICKQFSENLVNESGNVPRRGPVSKFSDLEVVAYSTNTALLPLMPMHYFCFSMPFPKPLVKFYFGI